MIRLAIRKALWKFPRIKLLIKGLIDTITQGKREALTMAELIRLLNKDNPVILDIGCNDGGHTKHFLENFNKAEVYSFEPDNRAIELYKKNIKNSRAKLFEIALSDEDGQTVFHSSSGNSTEIERDWHKSGSIKKPKHHLDIHPWCKFETKFTVKTQKLDTWAKENKIKKIDFIWADVQGAEKNLIIGGIETLKNTRYFYTEYSNIELYEGQLNLKNIKKLLPGFKIIRKYRNDVLFKNIREEI
ncbi:MAG: FkbM family methyltransferase [Spirochaetia bacterium]|nr:FkbM family methyltransferase [Spirochaetia bacterium]